MSKLSVEYVDIDKLFEYEGNAKLHPESQIEQIKKSIEQFGQCDPLGVWTTPDGRIEIVEGHGRLEAMKRLGMRLAPVIRLDHLSDEQRRAYALVHNETTLSSGFDDELLALELGNIPEIDMSVFGFESSVSMDDFGLDFDLPEGDSPNGKTMSLHLTQEQYDLINSALDGIERDSCRYRGGNENGDKICEVVRLWAER